MWARHSWVIKRSREMESENKSTIWDNFLGVCMNMTMLISLSLLLVGVVFRLRGNDKVYYFFLVLAICNSLIGRLL